MRGFTIVIALALVAVSPARVFAKPRVAVTPIRGDKEAADAIGDAIADSARIIASSQVSEAMDQLGLSGDLEQGDVVRLQTKLRASVVVQGKVAKDGPKRTLSGTVSVRGKKSAKFTITYKKAGSEKFKQEIRDELVKRIADAEDLADDKPEKKKDKDKDKRDKDKKVADADEGPKMMKRVPAKKEPVAEAPPPKKKKKVATKAEPDDPPKKKKKKKVAEPGEGEGDGDGDGEGEGTTIAAVEVDTDTTPRNPVLTPAARFDIGASGGVRQLTYEGTGAMRPPRVGTGGGGAHFEGELYPFAFSDPKAPAAGLGLAFDFDKTVGLSILAPGTNTSVPVDQGRWSIGARYRFNVAPTTLLALGAAYAKRHYLIQRGGPALDAPDVDYSSINPNVWLRTALAPQVTLYLRAGGMLIFDTGGIQKSDSMGAATVLGFGGEAGLDIALAPRFALRISGDYNQIDLSFKGTNGQAMTRGVTAATDRQFGAAATVGVMY
ncbi:MAG: hypothetical protein KF773_41055 [Deltaproteobacteria bacterium]|nr:hypothetical protein [Deltaproteobacteria bacterium]